MDKIEKQKIALLGGGQRCKAFLQVILSEDFDEKKPEILGVADNNERDAALQYAKDKGIFTTSDVKDLFSIKDLNLILQLTRDDNLRAMVQDTKPPWILLVDHHEAQSLVDYYLVKGKKNEILTKLRKTMDDSHAAEILFEEFCGFVLGLNVDRNVYFQKVRKDLAANEWALSQIIQGSTIPTFVIDKDHTVTHWNRACEVLTGFSAEEIVGTDRHWKPFRSEKRPLMADLILDGVSEEDLWRQYTTRWEKSDLIEGAYEAEEFFPQLGRDAKWVFFTAAPIKAPDGSTVGAIETLWDKTKEKLAEQERERQNKELAQKVRELTANEKAMSQIILGSTIPTFVIDKDHTVTHWNRAMEKLTGYSTREIVGTKKQWAPFYEKERPSMADVIVDQIGELEIRKLYGTKWRKSLLIEGAYEADVFFPNLGKDGKWCWFTAAPIKTPEGEVVGAIETIWDKTEDRKAEKERERHTRELATYCSIYATLSGPLSLEGRIKAAIQEVANIFLIDGICIYILDKDGKFYLQYNYGYSENLCYRSRVAGEESMISRVAMHGKTLVFSNLPDFNEDDMNLLRQEGLRSLVYIPILDKEKRAFGVIWAASKNTGHFGPDETRALELIGNRIGVAIENAMLQEEVKRKADFQGKLIGSSNDGVVATDDKWNIVIFNPAAEKIFGYSASDVIGKMTIREIYPPAIIQNLDELLAAGSHEWNLPWRETAITAKNGEGIPVRFSGTILHARKRMMGSVAFFNDLREIKRLEKELVGAERLAAIGQTVAGMAHGIKNILHGLKGGSYLVNIGINKDNPEKLKAGWQMVQRNIGRTSDLVQDLLSYSKGREPEYKACFPNEIADDVCELMKEVAGENNVVIERKLSELIGEVVMDPRTIHSCLLNLVSNAIDACRYDDSVTKTHCVTVTSTLESDNFIRFDVSDNGSGMTDEVKEKIFGSFFSTKGSQGTGLGLLVSRKLVEEHGGTIDVTSQLGEGTTFSVRLPFETKGQD
ncbi:MAG: PAS domain S-box protein [Desulfobacterales bacterium]